MCGSIAYQWMPPNFAKVRCPISGCVSNVISFQTSQLIRQNTILHRRKLHTLSQRLQLFEKRIPKIKAEVTRGYKVFM
jgi:hypothetical protein